MWQLRIYDMKHFWDRNYHLMDLVKEVPEEPDTSGIFEVDGKTYRWCAKNFASKIVGVKEVTLDFDPDEENEDDLKCPYCGSVYEDAWEMSADEDKIECSSCNSTIEYQRETYVRYTVTPVKMAEIRKL